MQIPMSLRTTQSETAYQLAKTQPGALRPLCDEPSIQEWEHWRLIANRFPYDVAYAVHHMLVPKRQVADFMELHDGELLEFYDIIATFVEPNYDLWFVNTHKKRSILAHFHAHLASYVASREDMKL